MHCRSLKNWLWERLWHLDTFLMQPGHKGTNMLFNRRSHTSFKELQTSAQPSRVVSPAKVDMDLAAVASLSLSAVVKRRSSSRRRLRLPPNKCRPHSWHATLQRGFLRTARSRSSGRGGKWPQDRIDSSILDGTCVTKMCERVSSTLCRAILEEVVLLGTRQGWMLRNW